MKTLKTVAALSIFVLAVVAVIFATIPLRFPGSTVFWQGLVPYLFLFVTLSILPVLSLKLSLGNLRIIIVGLALVSILMTGIGMLPLIIVSILSGGSAYSIFDSPRHN